MAGATSSPPYFLLELPLILTLFPASPCFSGNLQVVSVQLPALVDTGSMRSILSMDVYQQILDRSRPQGQFDSFSDNSNKCISVTGQPLTTKGSVKIQIMFPASDHLYHIDFLVCGNMSKSLNCILG